MTYKISTKVMWY